MFFVNTGTPVASTRHTWCSDVLQTHNFKAPYNFVVCVLIKTWLDLFQSTKLINERIAAEILGVYPAVDWHSMTFTLYWVVLTLGHFMSWMK